MSGSNSSKVITDDSSGHLGRRSSQKAISSAQVHHPCTKFGYLLPHLGSGCNVDVLHMSCMPSRCPARHPT